MPAKKKTVIVDGEVMDADDPRYLEYIGACDSARGGLRARQA